MLMVVFTTKMVIAFFGGGLFFSFFFKRYILSQPGNLIRCVLRIENVLSVISMKEKEKPHNYSPLRRSGDAGIPFASLHLSESGGYCV